MKERADKWIASRSSLSRKDVKALLKAGKVRVNETVISDPGLYITDADVVCVDGKSISAQKHIYIMQNKPKGVVSVSNAPGDKTVIDLLPADLKRSGLFPAGRLDKDTTGFVLITDDGDFAHRILSPRRHVTKTYTATLRDAAEQHYAEAFKNGIVLGDGTQCLSAELEETNDPHVVVVHLHEGRYHQVKLMFASLGNAVVELHRERIGGLPLDPTLAPGESRLLSAEEVAQI